MLPTMDQFKTHIEKAMSEQVEWMTAEFSLGDLPITHKIVDVPTGPMGQARISRKNKEFQSFQVKFQSYHFLRDEIKAYVEYSSYNAWPVIGGFETNDWRIAVDALVAHELSHVVQFALKIIGDKHPLFSHRPDYPNRLFFAGIGEYESGHGYFFRQIYKRFREQFVNGRVPVGAYTDPKKDFVEGDHFEQRMSAKTGDHPLVGVRFNFKNRELEIVGRNPRNAKLFGYMVKLPNGNLSKVKLSLIYHYSGHARSIVESTSWLWQELQDLEKAEKIKRAANIKSSITKTRRARMR